MVAACPFVVKTSASSLMLEAICVQLPELLCERKAIKTTVMIPLLELGFFILDKGAPHAQLTLQCYRGRLHKNLLTHWSP